MNLILMVPIDLVLVLLVVADWWFIASDCELQVLLVVATNALIAEACGT